MRFRTARLFNALYFSLDINPLTAATNAIYEVYHATDDLNAIEDIVSHKRSSKFV